MTDRLGILRLAGDPIAEDDPPEDPNRVMLLQRDFIDSQLHFWARRAANSMVFTE